MDCKSIQSSSSSSSSSDNMIWKHDVFLSFRGEDTRNNFVDHLFAALQRRGIITFKDDKNLKKGEPISPKLLQAIEESQISIVVLSENYASSTWCLRELVKMVDFIGVPGRSVFPIFYDVTPSEVRKQSGSYEKAFSEHGDKEDLQVLQTWRHALTQVANLSGWIVQDKPQNAEVDGIVNEVCSILDRHKVSNFSYDLVGIQSRVEELEKLLVSDSSGNDTRVVGICGMSGIGKTTLASVIYERLACQYDACCFMDDVNRVYQDYGAIGAQKQLLSQTLNENLEISNCFKGTDLIRRRLRHLKVFIVIDNVEKGEQLEKLAVKREWIGAGSRIILISRDRQILTEFGVDGIYNMQLLNRRESLQLFCQKAFKSQDLVRDFRSMTDEALKYAQGHPLAIKVLGSFLFGRDVSQWRSALMRMREYPTKDIMDVLRIGFDALDYTEKEIFLDIACFFNIELLSEAKEILHYRGFYPEIGIPVLVEKSLITISRGGFIHMHSLLEKLGKKIVGEKSPQEPGKWSRLWLLKDFHNVLSKNKATENIEVMYLPYSHKADTKTPLVVGCEALMKMSRLRVLKLYDMNFSGSLTSLSNELRYLYWSKCPLTCLPSSFQPYDLVELKLPRSSMKQLWNGVKHLPNLKVLNLANSKNLEETPDFRGIPNLKELVLGGCTKLVCVNSSIGLLSKLTHLNLNDCTSLMSLPESIFCLTSLESLTLQGCSNIFNNKYLYLELARQGKRLKMFDFDETAKQGQLMSSSSLWPTMFGFSCLQKLNLSFCNLGHIPDDIGCLHNLKILYLDGNNFLRLPSTLKMLSKLTVLSLTHCKHLITLPELTTKPITTTTRRYHDFNMWPTLNMFDCPKLTDISGCIQIAFLWIIRAFQMSEESSLKIVIPGSDIPRWFNNQSADNLLVTENMINDTNCIGIAVCVAFLAYHDPNILRDGYGPRLQCQLDNHYTFSLMPVVQSQVEIEREHLAMHLCTKKEYIWKQDVKDNALRVRFTYGSGNGMHVEVIKCGLRWVYKEDLDELINISRGSNNIQIHDVAGMSNQLLLQY